MWEQYYPARATSELGSYFLVAKLENGFGTIRFGDEGQQWAHMSIEDFLAHPEIVQSLKARLRDYLSQPTSSLFRRSVGVLRQAMVNDGFAYKLGNGINMSVTFTVKFNEHLPVEQVSNLKGTLLLFHL